jgi:hypothetical protein
MHETIITNDEGFSFLLWWTGVIFFAWVIAMIVCTIYG